MLGKIIRRAIQRIINWSRADEQYDNLRKDASIRASRLVPAEYTSTDSFNFTVTNAIGGKVITVKNYDIKTDRTYEKVYIVTDKEDLGNELGQIITRESLSR